MPHDGLRFGVFLAPFHRVGDNPTLAIANYADLNAWLRSYREIGRTEHTIVYKLLP